MSVETNSHNYTNMNNTFSQFSLSPARIPPKQKEEQMENSSPNPSFSICDIRIQKQMSRSFGKSFPQKIVLPKLRPHCSATCPNTWRAEPRKKNTLSFFKKKFTPAKSGKPGVFFFRGCRGSARQWRNDTSVRGSLEPPRAPRVRLVGIRVAFKIHSNFVQ